MTASVLVGTDPDPKWQSLGSCVHQVGQGGGCEAPVPVLCQTSITVKCSTLNKQTTRSSLTFLLYQLYWAIYGNFTWLREGLGTFVSKNGELKVIFIENIINYHKYLDLNKDIPVYL